MMCVLWLSENKNRRNSSGDLLDGSNKLRKQNRLLAKSTTALNILKEEEKQNSAFALRGLIFLVITDSLF